MIMTSLLQPGINISELCENGDKFLNAGEVGRATSLYMSAFSAHATSTLSHMRKLENSSMGRVISTLEGWLDNHWETQPVEGLHKGLVAVFLSTLCPNNLSATVFKMESLLQSGGHGCDEIFARCTTLLEGRRTPQPEGAARVMLEITRALACLFSEPHSVRGLMLYLSAYKSNKSETVKLVKRRQALHLPKIVEAFTGQLMYMHHSLRLDSESEVTDKEIEKLEVETASAATEFLLELSPENAEVQELQAAHLLSTGRYGESAEAYSAILQHCHRQPNFEGTDKAARGTPERRARLLTSKAVACFSSGGRVVEACKHLGEAFEIHPACARMHFQSLLTDHGTGSAARNHVREEAERGLSCYKERVLIRSDLRSTEGVELLEPVITQLRTLCHLEPDGGGRELRVRLAECLLLRGEHKEALSICSQLAAAKGQQSYQNTVQVLRGFARLLTDDHKGALEDFQGVIEHNAPHPSSCVRALCGRGLLRMMCGSNYLTALDYLTASRLQLQETALTVRCLVPWNSRGLLVTVLLEQGQVMLEGAGEKGTTPASRENSKLPQQMNQLTVESKNEEHRAGTSAGVHSLAALLMELQPSTDGPQILAADALYQLGRVEEAYRLLLSIGPASSRAPILARLALLQLNRGFLYDSNQLLKKLIQCAETSCLRPLVAVAQKKDRALLQMHSHSAAKRILEATREENAVREAVAYLTTAIIISGGEATESLLERAKCYTLLGQRKTAVFDFSAILRENPKHIQALCGRGFTYLIMNQQKECICDIVTALRLNAAIVTKDIMSLKDKARKLVCDWLHQFCRSHLIDLVVTNSVPYPEEKLREVSTIAEALMKTDCKDPRWHLLYIDILIAKGEVETASAHLSQVFGLEPRDALAQARLGVVVAWQQNYCSAAHRLSKVAENNLPCLDFLLALIPFDQKKYMAQIAAQEASIVSSDKKWDQAIPLLTVAVQAAGDSRRHYLRQRAACLSHLGLHKRAIDDLDRVIQKYCSTSSLDDPQALAEDLCLRGHSLMVCSREGPALDDFNRALELDKELAIQSVEAGPGKLHLAQCFLRGALQHYGKQQLDKAWTLIECGLVLDNENVELRRLRSKVKRELTSPCNVN